MALTPEQQSQLELQTALQNIANAADQTRRQHEKEMEALRHSNNMALAQAQANAAAAAAATANNSTESAAKQIKLEAVRLAKETLIENRRNKPASEREISADDIKTFAQSLLTYVNT